MILIADPLVTLTTYLSDPYYSKDPNDPIIDSNDLSDSSDP